MKSLKSLTAMAVLLAASGALSAQQARGDVELGFQGMYASMSVKPEGGESSTTNMGLLQATFGVFVTNHLELGLSPTVTVMTAPDYSIDASGTYTSSGNKTTTTTGASLFATWSFLASGARVSPYAGLALYKQDFSDSDEKGSVGVTGGCKFYIAPKAAINVGLNYMVGKRSSTTPDITVGTLTIKGGTTNMTTNTLLFQIGFSYLF